MANAKIDTVDARAKMKGRHAPRWIRLESGCYLGYRKTVDSGIGSWLTRYHNPEKLKHEVHSLGSFETLPASQRFDAARRAADEWFKHLGMGGKAEAVTVEAACRAYVKHLRAMGREATADDNEARFRRWVLSNLRFADTTLPKLKQSQLETWRLTLVQTRVTYNYDKDNPKTRERSLSSVNRDMTALRAALNHALDCNSVTSDRAWRIALRPFKNAGKKRDIYLDVAQRRKLVEHAAPTVAPLLRGMGSLPLRPGALVALHVEALDLRLSVLSVGKDKHGQDRKIKLGPDLSDFLAKLIDGKPPGARIFAQPDGRPWTKDDWKEPVKQAAKAAELPEGTVAYSLRHSVITDLVGAGVPLLTIAQISGTSYKMIEQHYGHLLPDAATHALDQLVL